MSYTRDRHCFTRAAAAGAKYMNFDAGFIGNRSRSRHISAGSGPRQVTASSAPSEPPGQHQGSPLPMAYEYPSAAGTVRRIQIHMAAGCCISPAADPAVGPRRTRPPGPWPGGTNRASSPGIAGGSRRQRTCWTGDPSATPCSGDRQFPQKRHPDRMAMWTMSANPEVDRCRNPAGNCSRRCATSVSRSRPRPSDASNAGAATSSCRHSPPVPPISPTIWRSAITICATCSLI